MSKPSTMSEEYTLEEWIELLEDQADYTREYRHDLYQKVEITTKKDILDVGSGPGIVAKDMASFTDGHITGIDISDKAFEYAKGIIPDSVDLMVADVLDLPFRNNTFDLVVFTVVLPYIKDQQRAVNEMARVTQKNGIVLATSSPDYAGALHYPESRADLDTLKHFEERSVDIRTGRKLKYLFRTAGLKTEIGICDVTLDFVNKDVDEQMKDFVDHFPSKKSMLLKIGWTEQEIEEYKQEMIELIQEDLGFGFVPAFYAIGTKL